MTCSFASPVYRASVHLFACPMRRLTTAPNLAIATLWADMLTQGGFEASVQRAYASSIAGEVPPDQCLPEVWVMDETQHDAAVRCSSSCATGRTGIGCARRAASASRGPSSNAGAAAHRCRPDSAMTRLTARTALLMTLPPLLWAGNAVVGRMAVGNVPPLMLNCLRWAVAALILLPLGSRALQDIHAIA